MKIFFLLSIMAIPVFLFSQNASIKFKKATDTLRKGSEEITKPIIIAIEKFNIPEDEKGKYILTARINDAKSTLARSEYSLSFNSIALDKVSNEYKFYISLSKDEGADQDKYVYLDLEILKDGSKSNINSATSDTTLTILIESYKSLNTYDYLAYVGTNFDLIDGVQAKNLFFATNLMTAPIKKKGIGFTLTLYGNRTTTSTDTSGRTTYTSKAVPIGGDSARFYTESALKTVNRVSDNLGASFSPLFRMGHLSDAGRVVQLYYAPQFEFIWRRIKITTRYVDAVVVDSLDRPDRPFSRPIILTEPVSVTPINVYDVYIGLAGVVLTHENKNISVRVQMALGWNVSYTSGRATSATRADLLKTTYARSSQLYLFCRAWITEPFSGVTIGAEVSNNLFKNENAQPYYNVTLSKAIKLSSLSGIFQPVGNRNSQALN